MVKGLLFMVLGLAGYAGYAQGVVNDMIVLRNHQGHTIKSYFPGQTIDFGLKEGREIAGIIRIIRHDSIFIQEYDIRRAYTQWGTSVMDTVTSYLLQYHYDEIAWIRKKTGKFEFVRDGTLFMIGGTAYMVLHLVNAAYLHQPVIGSTMAIAGGIAVTGFIMHRMRKLKYPIGKNYHMEYIAMH